MDAEVLNIELCYDMLRGIWNASLNVHLRSQLPLAIATPVDSTNVDHIAASVTKSESCHGYSWMKTVILWEVHLITCLFQTKAVFYYFIIEDVREFSAGGLQTRGNQRNQKRMRWGSLILQYLWTLLMRMLLGLESWQTQLWEAPNPCRFVDFRRLTPLIFRFSRFPTRVSTVCWVARCLTIWWFGSTSDANFSSP